MNDWMKNVMPLTTDKNMISFSVYHADLSSVALTDFLDKIARTHFFPKPGRFSDLENNMKLSKKVWETSNENIAVYQASSSGPPQYHIVTRYKEGLKERERNFRKLSSFLRTFV